MAIDRDHLISDCRTVNRASIFRLNIGGFFTADISGYPHFAARRCIRRAPEEPRIGMICIIFRGRLEIGYEVPAAIDLDQPER